MSMCPKKKIDKGLRSEMIKKMLLKMDDLPIAPSDWMQFELECAEVCVCVCVCVCACVCVYVCVRVCA
jgi:hypothetical protein